MPTSTRQSCIDNSIKSKSEFETAEQKIDLDLVEKISSKSSKKSLLLNSEVNLEKEIHTSGLTPKAGTIYEGDALEVLKLFPDHYFDAGLADPPYFMSKRKALSWAFSSHITLDEEWDKFSCFAEYEEFSRAWLEEVLRVVKPNGNIFIFGSFHNIYQIGYLLQAMDLRILNSIVWFKPNAQPNITCRMFTESTEYLIWVCNNNNSKATGWTYNYKFMKKLNNGKQMRNLWEIPVTPKSERTFGCHPAQKPLAVLERVILAGTNPEDLIIDCFSGTGTTAVVAEENQRRWVMIEKERRFNDIARRRLGGIGRRPFKGPVPIIKIQ